jgi:DNA-binding TFAR19-related protein (PDSD5 family)
LGEKTSRAAITSVSFSRRFPKPAIPYSRIIPRGTLDSGDRMKKLWYSVLLFSLSSLLASAQQGEPLPQSLSHPDGLQQNSDSNQSLGDLARHVRKDHSEEAKLTPEDAKKLFEAVDKLTAFASEDSGFPQHSSVKRQLLSPDEIEKIARAKMAREEFADRFERAQLTMKKFGLLPRDFDLKEFLIKIQRKDIAAFYDPETKTISVMNTVPAQEQQVVLAHELTHALQDQNYDLRAWAKPGNEESKDEQLGKNDETSSARRAALEGQATMVMMDYLLSKTGRSLANTPGLIYRMEDPLVKYSVDTQIVHDAPMILRESGTFPYRDGLIFEGELLQAGGKKMAFSGVFAHPPLNTHEVIQPRAYLNHEKLPVLPFPDARSVLQDEFDVFDSGTVGELDVRALLWQFGSRTLADDLSKSWQGGAYMAFRSKSAAPATTADLKMFYVSRWSSDQAAQRFTKFYVNAVSRRYQNAQPTTGAACSGSDCPLSSWQFNTEEGPVIVELSKNNTVVVSESFDIQTAAKLSAAARAVTHKTVATEVPRQELGMRLYDLPAFRRFQQQLGDAILKTAR